MARYQALIPNADVVEVTDIGHYPQIESAELVLESIFGFIED
ncbi:alpha/beta fold hydrolase [Alteromonas mediterranea]|nr:hypothetical protein [Alteromonas mediterranea]